jgi:hypothetical protein
MIWDILIAIGAGLCQLALAYMGWRVTIKAPPRKRKLTNEAAFFLLGLIGVVFIGFGAARNSSVQQDIYNLLRRINPEQTGPQTAVWASLTPGELISLGKNLKNIESEPVSIACDSPDCKALAKSFGEAFRLGGWTDVKIFFGGGIGITGVNGLVISPGDERTSAIIDAIEKSSDLKVERPTYLRSQIKSDPGISFVVGKKPF